MATAFNNPDQWRQATEPRGVHREAPLTKAEKAALAAFISPSLATRKDRLLAQKMEERRAVRRAEDDQADMGLTGGTWS